MPMRLARLSIGKRQKSDRLEPFFTSSQDQLSSAGISSQIVDASLDASIWSELPDCLLHLVFSKLPIKCLNRLRCLNRRWESTAFFTSSFQPIADSHSPRFGLVSNNKALDRHEAWIFDTPAAEWCRFSLPFSSSAFSGPFASAGGLLCYISKHEGHTLQVLVCNPITGFCRKLPPTLNLHEFPTLIHMVMDCHRVQYSIIMMGVADASLNVNTEMFNSVTNTWSTSDSVTHKGSYYKFFIDAEYKGLATVDSTTGNVTRVQYPYKLMTSSFLDRQEDKCWILESEGSLYMSSNAPGKEGIWQLLGSVWKKVCEHPKIMRRYEKISLFLSDNVALLLGTEPLCFRPQFEDLPPHQFKIYDKVSRKWSVLPSISASFGHVEQIDGGILFEPRFDTKP